MSASPARPPREEVALAEPGERAPWARAGVAVVLLVVATLLVRSLPSVPYFPDSDDGYYLRYASAIAAEGPSAFPRLFAEYTSDARNFNYPPPNRLAYALATGAWAAAFGPSLPGIAHTSLVSHLAFVAVTFLFARRFLGETRAFWLATACAFSPLLLGMGRQALSDSFVLLAFSLPVWTFLGVVERPGDRRWKIAFVAAFAFAILTKELAALLALPFAAFWAIERWGRRREDLRPALGLALLALPAAIAAPLWVLAAGGVGPLVTVFRGILAGPGSNPYTIEYGSGPWYRYVVDFVVLSHAPTLLAVGFAGSFLVRVARGGYERVHAYFGVLAALLLFEHSFVTKNARYLMLLELPLRLYSIGMLAELARAPRSARAAAAVTAAVASLAWLDVRSFEALFVAGRAYDPVSAFLLVLRGIVPGR